METVWVIQSLQPGESEEYGLDAVSDSASAAIAWIKSQYSNPYLVEWSESKVHTYHKGTPNESQECTLIGTFKPYENASYGTKRKFDIKEEKVITLPAELSRKEGKQDEPVHFG